MNFLVISRFQTECLEGEVFKGFQHIGAPLEQNFLVASIEIGENFGRALSRRTILRNRAYVHSQFEPRHAQDVFEEIPQGFSGGQAVQLSFSNKFRRHFRDEPNPQGQDSQAYRLRALSRA